MASVATAKTNMNIEYNIKLFIKVKNSIGAKITLTEVIPEGIKIWMDFLDMFQSLVNKNYFCSPNFSIYELIVKLEYYFIIFIDIYKVKSLEAN
jgi:hypothetical protein